MSSCFFFFFLSFFSLFPIFPILIGLFPAAVDLHARGEPLQEELGSFWGINEVGMTSGSLQEPRGEEISSFVAALLEELKIHLR